ncbi:MAG: hypothetical protein RL769_809 [Pseudomonadota bacterium]|jgi:hypothetical protein
MLSLKRISLFFKIFLKFAQQNLLNFSKIIIELNKKLLDFNDR